MPHKDEKPILYMIRHGEKNPKQDGEDPIGLSSLGQDRANALVNIFGRDSPYNIRYIIAQHPKKSGKRARPYETIKPLFDSLGGQAELNIDIDRDDQESVAEAVLNYDGPGNILICWEHHQLLPIAVALGIPEDSKPYNDSRYDVIWTLDSPYHAITSETSEHCPVIDDKYINDP